MPKNSSRDTGTFSLSKPGPHFSSLFLLREQIAGKQRVCSFLSTLVLLATETLEKCELVRWVSSTMVFVSSGLLTMLSSKM